MVALRGSEGLLEGFSFLSAKGRTGIK